MKKLLFIISVCLLAVLTFSCNKQFEPKVIHNAVKDYDGNSYDAVKIGKQVWMKSNLRTTHYADGTPIAQGIAELDHTPGYCEVPGSDVSTTGLFYNWYAAVRDTTVAGKVQGVCPKGWHLPNDEEWKTLIDFAAYHYGYLYGDRWTGSARSLAADAGWEYEPPVNEDSLRHVFDSLTANDPNWNPNNIPWEESNDYIAYWQQFIETYLYCPGADPSKNNESQFTALPVGEGYLGTATNLAFGHSCCFWSSTPSSYLDGVAHVMWLYKGNAAASVSEDSGYDYGRDKRYGNSVRCLRD